MSRINLHNQNIGNDIVVGTGSAEGTIDNRQAVKPPAMIVPVIVSPEGTKEYRQAVKPEGRNPC